MTEKRFTMDNESNIIEFDYNTNEYIQDFMWADGKSWDKICNRLNELFDENEQLKQRNDRQVKQLDRLYCLIEEKDYRTLNDILDDFKRCEEQLRKEWGTYGDVE